MIDSDATPGGCWVHYPAVLTSGYRELEPGIAVEFTFEAVEQDGCAFRAVGVWPAGQEQPVRPAESSDPSAAYRSVFQLDFDGEPR